MDYSALLVHSNAHM